ncbi:extracellular solute-binding protein [Utexia brackfieldae]|uniref:extracellular solute-binding protein n=1 Tax=Utexia brackfieldae TaxID=3074108 RepID=UPI00370DD725
MYKFIKAYFIQTVILIASLQYTPLISAEEIVELIPDDPIIQSQAEPSVQEKLITSEAFSILGTPKYTADFQHFDYVNPAAPKGGTLRRAIVANFDNFNRFSSRGAPEQNSGELYDTLFTMSEDEDGSYYPLIALSATHPADYQWAEVKLNPAATFNDGVPVTAQDVEFSFHKFMTEGVLQYRTYYQNVTIKALDQETVRIELPEPDREKMIGLLSGLKILPQHFWQYHRLDDPLPFPPLGGAAYRVGDYKLGQYAQYVRVPDYWAKDLPVNVGQNNFDTIRYEYYLDDNVALEAFKAGAYDLRVEAQPKYWFTQYHGDNFDKHYIIKQESPVTAAPDSRWLAFNLQKPIFTDIRVRQAISLAFDFAWLNRTFYYDSFQRPMSYFENTPYAATGLPDQQELELLKPYQGTIPDSVFSSTYQLPPSSGDGFNRENLLKARDLLAQAGWIIQDQQLINQQTKQPFTFELLVYMGASLQYVIPFQQNLKRLGIDMQISAIDYSQLNARLRKRDYDMMPTIYYAYPFPSTSLRIVWGSDYLNSSWNSSGLHNQAIDSLIEQIGENQSHTQQLISLGRALDRVLTHEYAMIPMWYPRYIRYAYWHKISMPAIKPKNTLGIGSWWYDNQKAQTLPSDRR